MDFGTLVTALSLAFNLSASPPATDANLTSPDLISSQNISVEQSLNVLKPNEHLEMVMKPEPPEIITVEQPPAVYTVLQPVPKPSSEEEVEEDPKPELIKEAKADEPSPSPSASPSSTPTPFPSTAPSGSTSTDSNGEKMFQMVNDYRAKQGLASLEKDSRLCEIATSRAPQINAELSNGTLHQGFKALSLSYWATENIAAYSTIEENLHFWLSDYIHKKAIESDNKYSCVACSGASCSQIFTSFVNK